MFEINHRYIKDRITQTKAIYNRGKCLFDLRVFFRTGYDPPKKLYTYQVDGNFGDYTVSVQFLEKKLFTACDCPYPGKGCKHIMAVLLDILNHPEDKKMILQKNIIKTGKTNEHAELPCLTSDEIRDQALQDRKKRSQREKMNLIKGDMFKGEHVVETAFEKQYKIALHDPQTGRGHCSCPDYDTNRLDTCEDILFASSALKKR